ncbi:MAG TPA: sigma-70 family RNA polymerase sigma factor [Acidimicrobiales bacterium]|nr:sigma-70 family RNA polymerase sigma factor [Acidimicrobiales bacterium]
MTRTGLLDHQLLDREDEARLGRAIAAGREAAQVLAGRRVRSPQRRAQLEATVAAGKAACDELVRHNLRLALATARRCDPAVRQGWADATDEALQNAAVGLCAAAQRFDFRRGTKFSTYATWWIRKALAAGRVQAGESWSFVEAASRLQHTEDEMLQRLRREPTDAELAEEMGETVAQVRAWRRPRPVGLDAIGPEPDTADHEQIAAAELRLAVRQALGRLDEQARQVVELRFGFDGGGPRTLAQCADALGMSLSATSAALDRALATVGKDLAS